MLSDSSTASLSSYEEDANEDYGRNTENNHHDDPDRVQGLHTRRHRRRKEHDDGRTIFHEKIADKNISRQFRILTDDNVNIDHVILDVNQAVIQKMHCDITAGNNIGMISPIKVNMRLTMQETL